MENTTKNVIKNVTSAIQGMIEPLAIKLPANGNWRSVVLKIKDSYDISDLTSLAENISMHIVEINFGFFSDNYYSFHNCERGPHAMLAEGSSEEVEKFFNNFVDSLFENYTPPSGASSKPVWNRVIPLSYIVAMIPPTDTESDESVILERYKDIKDNIIKEMFSVIHDSIGYESDSLTGLSGVKKDPYGLN